MQKSTLECTQPAWNEMYARMHASCWQEGMPECMHPTWNSLLGVCKQKPCKSVYGMLQSHSGDLDCTSYGILSLPTHFPDLYNVQHQVAKVTAYLVCRKVEILLGSDDLPDLVEAESKCIAWQCILANMHQRVSTYKAHYEMTTIRAVAARTTRRVRRYSGMSGRG